MKESGSWQENFPSATAANGYLFVASGYGMFAQAPGNVVLAFRPKAK